MTIREYEEARDRQALRACFVELQESERSLAPELPAGETIADRYLDHTLERCRETSGKVFVAEVDEKIVGYVSVFGRVVPDEPDDPDAFAFVNDLVVTGPHRGRGIGRALLERAESFARAGGTRHLRISVLARNRGAHRLYQRLGYADREVILTKELK